MKGVKTMKTEILETTALGPIKDLDRQEIVDPWAFSIIGQTPHR